MIKTLMSKTDIESTPLEVPNVGGGVAIFQNYFVFFNSTSAVGKDEDA